MRLTLHLRGIDLLNVEFTAGSKGLLLDVDWFKPVDAPEKPGSTLEAAAGGDFERADGPVWGDDQPAVVRVPFGFR